MQEIQVLLINKDSPAFAKIKAAFTPTPEPGQLIELSKEAMAYFEKCIKHFTYIKPD